MADEGRWGERKLKKRGQCHGVSTAFRPWSVGGGNWTEETSWGNQVVGKKKPLGVENDAHALSRFSPLLYDNLLERK